MPGRKYSNSFVLSVKPKNGADGTSVEIKGVAVTTDVINPEYQTNVMTVGSIVLLTNSPNDDIDVLESSGWEGYSVNVGDCYIVEANKHIYEKRASGWKDLGKFLGDDAVRIDIDNTADIISLDSEGKVRSAHSIVVHARIYEGSDVVTSGVTKADTLTAENLTIGECTPTVSSVNNGVVTITWTFTKGMTAAAASKTISLCYKGKTYSAVFSLADTKATARYRLMPAPSEVSFAFDSNTNTLSPASTNLYCGYTKDTGGSTVVVQNPSSYSIDNGVCYLYYRTKVNGSWGAVTTYNGSITVNSSTTVQAYEFIISTASTAAGVSGNNILDRRVVPVVKDGNVQERWWIEIEGGVNEVTFTKNHAGVVSASPATVRLLLKHLKGNAEETLTSIPSGFDVQMLNHSDTWETVTFSNFTRNTASDNYNGAHDVVYRLRRNGSEVNRVTLFSRWQYQRMLLPAGEYSDSKTFARTPNTAPLVHLKVSAGTNEYWYLVADTNVVNGVHHAPRDGSTYWAPAPEYEVLLTKALFAPFANLGSFIIYENFFLSQYGRLIDSMGNVTMVNAGNVAREYSVRRYTLNGNSVDDGLIVCKVAFSVSAAATMKITLQPSSENNYDFGAVGTLDSTALENSSQANIKNGSTSVLLKASGKTAVSTNIYISAGTHFLEIAYAKDSADEANDDNATFIFEEVGTNYIDGYSFTGVTADSGMTSSDETVSMVPYGWFDANDPMAASRPDSGYKFRPARCINALTGEEWLAGGKVHVDGNGNVTMQDAAMQDATIQNAVITESLMYNKVYRHDIQYNCLIAGQNHSALNGNIFMFVGNRSYNSVEVYLPPAYLFPGAGIRLITARKEDITYQLFIRRLSGEEAVAEETGNGNIPMNNFYAGIKFTLMSGIQFTGSMEYVEYDSYSMLELVSTQNPEYPNYYVWMIVSVQD